ncbi:MAG TPA: hypothetical protein VEC16_02650 [Alphaproteobacteria bacterium]|nr:hypothetical protein [Alphaproteobacteria bacterium]
MVDYDDFELSDEHTKARAYTEFKLSKVEEDNLKDIENTINARKVDASNKGFMMTYLKSLHTKIQNVKENERQFEGDDNANVNEYLERISLLMNKLRTM